MSRFAIFITIVLAVWAAMHSYVFWRLSTIPWVTRHVSTKALIVAAVVLWLSYFIVRFLEGRVPDAVVLPLEYLAANWVGFLFLLLCGLFAADVLTLGGIILPDFAANVRGGAVALAVMLGVFALVQGHRQPEVTEHEVTLEGLPPERDGTVMVAISDLHLGTMLGKQWLERVVRQVNALKPDVIVAVGDVVDGNAPRVKHLPPTMRGFSAPLGVWGVTGNHEFYAGVDACVSFFEASGMRVLRDRSEEVAPGLVLAGVDDLTAREQFDRPNDVVRRVLAGRPPGATVFLSHSPWRAREAAAAGAGLMISGHTHKGQIWPFSYLVRARYPLLSGTYQEGPMTVLVGRGTGTWGPRMRLWERGEILKITLRAKKEGQSRPS